MKWTACALLFAGCSSDYVHIEPYGMRTAVHRQADVWPDLPEATRAIRAAISERHGNEFAKELFSEIRVTLVPTWWYITPNVACHYDPPRKQIVARTMRAKTLDGCLPHEMLHAVYAFSGRGTEHTEGFFSDLIKFRAECRKWLTD